MKHAEERLDSVFFKPEDSRPYPTVEGILMRYDTIGRFRRSSRFGVHIIVKLLLDDDMIVLRHDRRYDKERDARADFARTEQVWEWASR